MESKPLLTGEVKRATSNEAGRWRCLGKSVWVEKKIDKRFTAGICAVSVQKLKTYAREFLDSNA
jgi:hypothetical protein